VKFSDFINNAESNLMTWKRLSFYLKEQSKHIRARVNNTTQGPSGRNLKKFGFGGYSRQIVRPSSATDTADSILNEYISELEVARENTSGFETRYLMKNRC
jgi:hypothetical protein